MINYSPYTPTESRDCSICLLNVLNSDEPVIAHNELHPVHVACLERWMEMHRSCPECRAVIKNPSMIMYQVFYGCVALFGCFKLQHRPVFLTIIGITLCVAFIFKIQNLPPDITKRELQMGLYGAIFLIAID
jgi:hypothetical protein